MKERIIYKLLLLLFCMTAIVVHVKAQKQNISGTVTSEEEGEILSGVSVMLQGSANGTITDAKGKYNLSIPNENAIIVFSFTGYNAQIIYPGATSGVY